MMMIMSIDYSMTSPGVCVYDTSKKLSFDNCKFFVYSKTKLKSSDNIYIMNQKMYTSQEERFNNLSEWVIAIVKKFNVDNVSIEGYSYGSRSNRLFDIGENTGVLKNKLWALGVDCKVYAPSEIKKHFTGKGNANKELMYDSLIQKENVDIKKMLKTDKFDSPVSDIIDSYAIMSLHVSGI